jgi:opacity protein-like surface antigen
VLLAVAILCAAWTRPATADQVHLAGGLGLAGSRALSSDVSDTYSFGFGLVADLHLVYSRHIRLSISAGLNYSPGTPIAGPLASNESGRLIQVPVLAAVMYTLNTTGSLTPYGGAGLGLYYTNEKLSFDSGLGHQEQSRTATELSWSAVLGVEQNKPFRLYAEGWFIGSGTGSVEGQEGSGTSLNTIQLRVGIRGRLK